MATHERRAKRDPDMARVKASPASAPSAGGLLADEDVLAEMGAWQAEGQRVALVTLVGVEGGAPRQPGAQMAVAEDGRFAGYLSGGCLEQAVVLEAQDVLAQRQNRLVRYGKGSKYMDIRLPCGSGLDLYFDQAIAPDQIAEIALHRARRAPVLLRTDLGTGVSTIMPQGKRLAANVSRRSGDMFERAYPPTLQLFLLGSGPGLVGIAMLAAALGLAPRVLPADEATRAALAPLGSFQVMSETRVQEEIALLDFASAAVLVFHDHDREPDILGQLLATDCFYIGALGNHAVHRARRAALAARGVSEADSRRIRAPVGSIPGAKSKATLAVGVLTELMAEAKARNLVA